jgi:hypothetical protein
MGRITKDTVQFSAPVPEVIEPGSPDIIVLKFADSKIPVFKETRDKDYVKYGEDNLYPEYLTYLFNKSAKHNAILTGKANYIFGNGYTNGDAIVNRNGDSLNDISKKCILDIQIYGGFRLEIIWSFNARIAEIYHVDYSCIRKGKGEHGGFYFKESWNPKSGSISNRGPGEFIGGFNPSEPKGSQIFEYNEYRPGVRFYPLPSYIGCNNYIETDIEISKYYLSAIRNGMMPSKMVQFYQGDPTDEKKKEIERRFAQKFSGAENAGRFILVFNPSKDKSVDISDLSASEVDKQFVELNKTCQQEIYAGHLVTSPMLFGIKTEGQLGGNTELYTSYSIFQNTYSKPRAKDFDKEINWLLKYSVFAGQYELQPTDPIGVQFDVKDVVNSLPKQFVFESLGIPKEMWALENIGADNRPTPTLPIPAPGTPGAPAPGTPAAADAALSNDNIKNLTAKQHQQIMRIIRQYSKGQLTELAAKALLRAGLGLSDDDINSLLGIEPKPVALSFEEQSEGIVEMFDSCGESKNDYEVLRSKRVLFSSELEAEGDEEIFIQEAFKVNVTATENSILELIKKDELITPEVIATTIKETVAFVKSKIASLIKKGYLEETAEKDGIDEIIKRNLPKGVHIDAPPPTAKINPAQISIKYSYEVKPGVGPSIIPTTRPFCIKMVKLNRLYSRADIENISARLGYSVFDRRGGWWGKSPECRHRWQSNIVIKKGGQDVA